MSIWGSFYPSIALFNKVEVKVKKMTLICKIRQVGIVDFKHAVFNNVDESAFIWDLNYLPNCYDDLGT